VKVLHVEAGRHLYGGARQVLYLIAGLAERGVDSPLVCPDGSAVARAARAQGARVLALPMGGEADLMLLPRLVRTMRRERPDLVHLHSRRGADTLGVLAARLAGVPCVLSRRVDNPEPRWLARRKYGACERVIGISEGIRRVLLDEGVPAERLVCVHSAVDAEAFDRPCDRTWLRAATGVEADGALAAVIAQLIPRKGHEVLLQALPQVLERSPDLQVLLLGQGPLQADLTTAIRRHGLEGRVHLLGFRRDLERLLCCLDLVVHPALMEGLGVSLLQAAAAGVPIVASRAGGIPEVVRDGENGLLVPPGDAAALAAAMQRLLADPGLRRRMGGAGRALVRREFSVEAMVEGNLAVYRDLA
jgi:glycosyltransferase involved in cell wall biosynthesis